MLPHLAHKLYLFSFNVSDNQDLHLVQEMESKVIYSISVHQRNKQYKRMICDVYFQSSL